MTIPEERLREFETLQQSPLAVELKELVRGYRQAREAEMATERAAATLDGIVDSVVPRCSHCGCLATRHDTDDEERRDCLDCECIQYMHPVADASSEAVDAPATAGGGVVYRDDGESLHGVGECGVCVFCGRRRDSTFIMVCDGCSTRLKPTFPEYARRVSNILAQAPKEAGAVVMVRRHDNGQLQFVPAERAAEFGVPVEEKKEAPPVATKVCPECGGSGECLATDCPFVPCDRRCAKCGGGGK